MWRRWQALCRNQISLKSDSQGQFLFIVSIYMSVFLCFPVPCFFQARSKQNWKEKSHTFWTRLSTATSTAERDLDTRGRNTSEMTLCFLPRWDIISQRVEFPKVKPLFLWHTWANRSQHCEVSSRVILCYCNDPGDKHHGSPHNWLGFCPQSIRNLFQNREGTELAHLVLSTTTFPFISMYLDEFCRATLTTVPAIASS